MSVAARLHDDPDQRRARGDAEFRASSTSSVQVPDHRPAHNRRLDTSRMRARYGIPPRSARRACPRGGERGDVRYPQPARGVGVELVLHQVRRQAGFGDVALGQPLAPTGCGISSMRHPFCHPISSSPEKASSLPWDHLSIRFHPILERPDPVELPRRHHRDSWQRSHTAVPGTRNSAKWWMTCWLPGIREHVAGTDDRAGARTGRGGRFRRHRARPSRLCHAR